MRTFFVALRAMAYATGFLFLWGWVSLRVRGYDRSLGIFLPAWTATPGILFMVAGGSLALLCVGVFVEQGRGTPAPFDAPRELVAVGPYRYVRNPMYVGAFFLLAGLGLYLHSLSILLLCVPAFLLAHAFVLLYEEPALRRQFGAAYEKYCETVPRWIPGTTGAKRGG